MTKRLRHPISTRLISSTSPLIDVLQRITETVRTAVDLQAVFRSVHAIIGEWMPVKNFYIALLERDDDGTDYLSFPFFIDERDPPPQGRFPMRKTLTGYVLRRGQPQLLDQKAIRSLTKKGELEEKMGTDCSIWLGVPLQTRDQPIGVLAVQSYDRRDEYGETEKQILSFVSDQIALAIELTRYREELQELIRDRTRELEEEKQIQEILFDISQAVYSAENLRVFLKAVQERIGRLMDARNFYVALYDPEIAKYRFPFFVDEFDQSESLMPEDLSNTLTEYVRCHGPLLADREVHQRLIDEGKVKGIVGTDSLIWLGIPLHVPGKREAIGVMVVQSYDDRRRYQEKEKRILLNISTTIALAIDRITLVTDLFHHFDNSMTSIRGNTEILHQETEQIAKLIKRLCADLHPQNRTEEDIRAIAEGLQKEIEKANFRIRKTMEAIEEATLRMNRVFKPVLLATPAKPSGTHSQD